MYKGISDYRRILNKYKNRPLLLYGDPDVDGLYSLKLEVDFAEQILGRTDYKTWVNDNRDHGFLKPVEELRGYLVITADFNISKAKLQELVDSDVVVLATDHHDIAEEDDASEFIHVTSNSTGCEGILICNQYTFEDPEKRYQSGAGVFYEVISKLYPDFATQEHRAMVGITLLSDVRHIGNADSRTYLKDLYKKSVQVGYFKWLMSAYYSGMRKDYQFGAPRLTRNFIDFSLSPFINSMLRYGMKAEAVDFVLGKSAPVGNIQADQKELVGLMLEKSHPLTLSNLHVICIGSNAFADQNIPLESFIGAVCSKYKDNHKNVTTLGLTIRHGVVTRASVRGKYKDVDYKMIFQSLGVDARGHKDAFGIKNFKPDRDGKIFNELNYQIADAELVQHHTNPTVIDVNNMMFTIMNRGSQDATENTYLVNEDRIYYRYTGDNYSITASRYKERELTENDILRGEIPDRVDPRTNRKFKIERDSDGNKQYKYIEYNVDGKIVKSFGVLLEDGLILPMLDRGYITLYVQADFNN
jgi:single-stranded-DNA-specific exonuclease